MKVKSILKDHLPFFYMSTKKAWSSCKNLLCVRLDNIGDLLMSAPAISALKESLGCKITLLTSSAAGSITPYLDMLDDVILYDAPWVKNTSHGAQTASLVALLKRRNFDGAVVFTTFSQNPMPAAMVVHQAHIPLRLAYCRENPYELLTHWVPEKEPYTFVRHQVRRDLDLVKDIGAAPADEKIRLRLPDNEVEVQHTLRRAGVDLNKPWLIVHAGVSEVKRQYATQRWVAVTTAIVEQLGYQVVLTGTYDEQPITTVIANEAGRGVFSIAGMLNMAGFITALRLVPVVVSVNTSAIHIAAALGTPVVVLYAMTNPQHTPWKVPARVLPFDVAQPLQSRNEVLRFVRDKYFPAHVPMPTPDNVTEAIKAMLENDGVPFPEVFDFKTGVDQPV
jgi:ADP-heptose:LPS heptosyltransferase